MKRVNPKYKKGDEVYVFMVFDSFSINSSFEGTSLMFLGKAEVLAVYPFTYTLRLKEVLFSEKPHLGKDFWEASKVHEFSYVWVERGEEAYKHFFTPSSRYFKERIEKMENHLVVKTKTLKDAESLYAFLQKIQESEVELDTPLSKLRNEVHIWFKKKTE